MAGDGAEEEPGEGRSWPVVLLAFLAMVTVVGATAAATRPARPTDQIPGGGAGGADLQSYAVSGPTAAVEAEARSAGALVTPPAVCHPAPNGAFRLAFYDDFDGTGPDPAWWTRYDSPGNDGNGLRRPDAIAAGGGLLTITARMVDGVLVSGGMANQLAQSYGRWEARVRTDPDPSAATSGVVLTWPASGRWPVDGETDIYETGPQPVRRPFASFVHYGEDNRQEEISHDADGSAWHDMTMEWTPDRITIRRDGELAGVVANRAAIPRVPHELTIQLDAWAPTMGDPVQLQVDWVRVYRWVEGGSC